MKNRLRGGGILWNGARLPEGRVAPIPARGESMSNLAHVGHQLKEERDQAQRKIEQLDQALKAPSGLNRLRGSVKTGGRTQRSGAKRRIMSAASRKRIAAAQRIQ